MPILFQYPFRKSVNRKPSSWTRLMVLRTKATVLTIIVAAVPLAPVIISTSTAHAATDCSPNSINLSGSSWLSGTGVNVCSNNGSGANNYVNNVNGVSTLSGQEWQCVELVNRLYLAKGWTTSNWYGNGGGSDGLIYHVPSGLTAQFNGSISYINPGDAVTMNNRLDPNGHVAIIDTVSGSTINLVNQNTTLSNLRSSAYISSGSLSSGNATFSMNAWAGYTVQGVIHAPQNTPPPVPQTPSSNSGVIYNPNTNFTQVFVEGPNNSLSTQWDTTGQSWNGPATVPAAGSTGTTYSAPAALYNPSTNFLEVFVQGPNNSLDAYWETVGQTWSGPAVVGGAGTTYSAPAVIYNPTTNFVEVFVQGPNNSLSAFWDTIGQNWNGPAVIGGTGTTYSDPTAILNQSTNFVQVFTEGASNSLNTAWDTVGQNWNGPVTLGNPGSTYSDAVPIYNPGTNFLEVFTQGPANSLSAFWDTVGQTWNGPVTLPSSGLTGTTYSDPFAIYNPNTNYVEVFTEGWSNSLYTYTDVVGQNWSLNAEPPGLTGWVYSDQAAAYNPTTNFIQLFTEGWSNSLNTLWGTSTANGQSYTGPAAEPSGTTGTTYSGPGE